jgi:hypothetical protein
MQELLVDFITSLDGYGANATLVRGDAVEAVRRGRRTVPDSSPRPGVSA